MTDRLADLEALLPQLPAAVDRRRLGDRLSKTVAELRESGTQIAKLEALMSLTQQVDFGRTPEQSTLLNEVRTEALEVGQALCAAEDENALRDASYDYGQLVKQFGRLDQALRAQWRARVTERYQPLINFGDLLTNLDEVADLGQRLAACGRDAMAVNLTAPAAELLEKVRALRKAFDALQSERTEKIGAGEVGDFLNALAERRATLAQVTDTVRAFLVANHALDRFNVLAH